VFYRDFCHWEKPYIFTCKNTVFLRVKISANQKSSFVAMLSCLGMDNSSVYIINRIIHGPTLGDMEFIFSCSPLISHSFAALTRSISMWTYEDKFHISAHPCFIFYVHFFAAPYKHEREMTKFGIVLTKTANFT